MGCDISGEQLWSWIDRDASELEEHIAVCPECRRRAARMRENIGILRSERVEPLPLPDRIGPYRVESLLGEGGQALVYEAEQPAPRRRVALKVLKGGHVLEKSRVEQFHRETQTLARLNHAAIATIYESGRTAEGWYYFAMELVEGQALHTYVKQVHPDRTRLLQIFLRLFDAVQYAHESGVIHRDLKPSNVMITGRGEPKILDFGLARLTLDDEFFSATVTRGHKVEGTPRYMSPEQARGDAGAIDARSDVYTLGVILYELLTGEPPNDVSVFTQEAINKICEEVPRRPSSRDRTIPRDLDAVLMKALEKDPVRRYQSVEEMADDVRRFLAGDPVLAKSPSAARVVWSRVRRHRAGMAVSAVAIVIAALGVWRSPQPAGDPENAVRRELLDIRVSLIREGATDLTYRDAMRVSSRYPELPEAVLLRAQAYYLHREKTLALRILEGEMESNPSCWPCGVLLRELVLELGSDGDVAAPVVWNDALASSAEAWYLRSFATVDWWKAASWAGEALELDRDHAMARAFLMTLAERSGDLDLSLAATKEVIDAGFDPAAARLRIGLLVRMERYREAVECCDDLIAHRPDHFQGHSIRGRVYRLMGEYGGADRDLTRAIELSGDDNSDWLRFHRGTVRWLLGRYDDALEDYLVFHANTSYVTFNDARLIVLLRETDQKTTAEEMLEAAWQKGEVDPWLQEIFNCLSGKTSPAQLVASARASGDSMRVCEACYYAGEVLLQGGDTAEAWRMFRESTETGVKTDPNNCLDAMSEYELAQWRLSRNFD